MPSDYHFKRTEGLTCGESNFLKAYAPSTFCGDDFNIVERFSKTARYFPYCTRADMGLLTDIAESLVEKGLLKRGRGKRGQVYRLTEDGERAWYGLVGGKDRAERARVTGYRAKMKAKMRGIDE